MNYWLMKSEADCYSIDDLKRDKTTWWEGVRNYQARNHMRAMRKGDLVLFYHSSSNPTGIAGIATISREALPDKTQFDKKNEYYEPRATPEKPIWYCPQVAFVKKLPGVITLAELKLDPELEGMMVRSKASRLSVQPVSEKHFAYIIGNSSAHARVAQ